MRPYALVATGRGADVRFTLVQELLAAPYTVLGWHVSDIEAVVASLIDRNVVFRHFDGMGQDQSGIWTSPSGARVAWFPDPDGNLLSLTQDSSGAPRESEHRQAG